MRKWIAFMLVLFLAVVAIGCGEKTPEHVHKFVDGICECGEKEPTTDVEVKPTEIKVSGEKAEIEVGEEFDLTIEVLPADAKNKNVRVVANPSGIVDIKDNKTVTGLKGGEVTITISSIAAPTVKKEIKLTVKSEEEAPVIINPESFEIVASKAEVEVGKTIGLSVNALPEGAKKDATWTSSDETIATVNNGIVKGIALGKVTITATSTLSPSVSATFEVTVIEAEQEEIVKPTSISIAGDSEVEVGYTIRFVASILPAGANPSIRWESTKPEVATIDDKGVITGVSEGTTYIIAYSTVDETIKSSRVKVKVTVDQSSLIPIVDLQGYEIVLMASSTGNSINPFLDGYTAADKLYRQQAWREMEAKYNCTIKVDVYPNDASWGPSRVTWINSQAELGKAQADFMQVAPTWLVDFSASGAMHPTTKYFAKYGKNQIEPAIKQSATYKGEFYAVSVGLSKTATYPVNGIFYNYGLIEKYKLESPAKMFNEGRWTNEDFVEWALAAQAVIDENMFVVSGAPQIYWYGMVEANGVKIADTTTLELNLKHKYSLEAIETLQKIVLGGAWDTAGIDFDEKVASFQGGRAIMQCGQVWFVKSSNRFPSDLWGDDTKYGYVPFPYNSNVGKENTFVNYVDQDFFMMAGQREYNHPSGVTYEDIYRPIQEMFLRTIQLQESDPSYDPDLVRRQYASKLFDDPESVDALLFYTAEKTLFDPIFDGIAYYYSGTFQSAIQKSVVNNTDFVNAMDEQEPELYNKFISIYG